MNFREMSGLEIFQAMREGKLPQSDDGRHDPDARHRSEPGLREVPRAGRPAARQPAGGRARRHLVRFERFPGWRHAVLPDAPGPAQAIIRDFIAR